ncbi:nickel-dependent lactate racemase [Solirubrobacter sp. CPCC 204708]|uniref:Nickel-dependent lactate racemase n=1 Tax=Solirubrobacter deserti TaxID=2282478 RepID=A0ABT4RQ22_9ACTN|nr:nickel-dependent lactate racemase [Solirubrobacter deserti]MBE2320600.1 nickel-dependent lactate racemase [Solirubrobacter deserti]MDA0140655.1 nickel-dependent lactate racemase [Solirubrobacter deserti]
MKVRLAYGVGGLEVELPDDRTTVVEPAYHAGAPDEAAVLRAALREPVAGPPLRELARPGMKIAISMCDGTRAQPRDKMIPAVLDELGVPDDDVVVLVATGTHRGNTDEEIRAMLGDELVERVRVVNHDARDKSTLTYLGEHGRDVPVWINTEWVEADLRITTGFVEPHFFAGFSGGPKLVTPGLAGLDTVLVLHDAARIGDPKATWGEIEENPVHADIRAAASAAPPHFAFDVILNREQRVIEAFGGELAPMHAAACEAARRFAMQAVPQPFDVVVTSNSGYPLDQNLYQAVKGMSAAAKVVKPGGLIVCAAECRDGFPGHGSYRELLERHASPREFLQAIKQSDHVTPDQWQVQIQYNIQDHARLVMHTGHLTDDELRAVHLEQTRDIAATIAAEGDSATVCVLPEGPQTIAYVG